jgi:hypothetical protein
VDTPAPVGKTPFLRTPPARTSVGTPSAFATVVVGLALRVTQRYLAPIRRSLDNDPSNRPGRDRCSWWPPHCAQPLLADV